MTKLIVKERGKGKTTELIKMSAEKGQYILVADENRRKHVANMAEKMGLHIPYPITLREALTCGFHGTFIHNILIDDADDILRMIFQVGITAMTFTKEVEEPFDIEAFNRTEDAMEDAMKEALADIGEVFKGD